MIDFPHKILVPQRPDYLVSRARLNGILKSVTYQRLITVSGPAGYGKTSLLIDFASDSPLPVCWYTLDNFDQEPWVFLDYLIASIELQFPGATQRTTKLLMGSGRNSFEMIVGTLVRELYTIGREFVIIIDDWHIVDDIPDVKNIVTHLLLHCPHCHMILASRSYPSLPDIMLLTARRQMCSFNESQLRFTAAEVAAVLEAGYHATISLEQAAVITERVHGWITGILLSLQATHTTDVSLSVSDPYAERQIYRFLVEQVFDQHPEFHTFLLDSALLEELTAEHCDTIFGRDDSRRLLEQLLRQHLFITELRPGVLRFHPLFREFLQEHYRIVDPQRNQRMAVQVADFYAAQGQWLLAFDRYIAVGAYHAAQQALAAVGEQLYVTGRLEILQRWFTLLPEDQLDTRLLCLHARVQLDLGHTAEARHLAHLAEAQEQPAGSLVRMLQAQLARIGGQYEYALEVAQSVLQDTQDLAQRAAALRTIAICHHRLGMPECAIQEFQASLSIEHQRNDFHAIAQLHRDLGICYKDMGFLDRAVKFYMLADDYWAMVGNTGLRSMSLNSKANAQHLAGYYCEAHTTLTTALQYAWEASVLHYQSVILSSQGDLYCDLQLWGQAEEAYEKARKIGGSAYLMSCLEVAQVRLLVRQQRYDAAAHMLRQVAQLTHRSHANEILLLNGWIAYGLKHMDQATVAAQQIIDGPEQSRTLIDLARAYLLQSQIAASTDANNYASIIKPLERAAEIADQLGHDTFLVVEIVHTRTVLRRAAIANWTRANQWLQRYQDLLLAAQTLDQAHRRPLLVVRTLGIDQILLNGQPVEIGWHKAREVLYYLLAYPDGASIDTLREAIWPDLKVERSRDTLRSAIYQLRSVLPRDLIVLHGRQVYRINREVVHVDYDAERFLQMLNMAPDDPEAILDALDLYRGMYLISSDNRWCAPLRAHLEQRYFYALHRVAQDYLEQRMYSDALIFYRRILDADLLDEMAHAGIMRCHIALGNRAAAINQYQMLRRILNEELGLDPAPSSEVENLYYNMLGSC
jgi:DNA-binding SARP family transcriptional activator